jgi:hypothetical protein
MCIPLKEVWKWYGGSEGYLSFLLEIFQDFLLANSCLFEQSKQRSFFSGMMSK